MKISFCQFANKPGIHETQNAKVNFCVSSKGLAVCLEVFVFLNVLTRHTNLFDECAARCVHLSLQEEECTSSSWGDSKMYTSASIANSQRMLTEINENGTIAKISIWVESNTVKHLKRMQISLILSWRYFSCLRIQRNVHMSLKCFFKSLCLKNTGQLFWKITLYEQ